jgi:hypothetical protein
LRYEYAINHGIQIIRTGKYLPLLTAQKNVKGCGPHKEKSY